MERVSSTQPMLPLAWAQVLENVQEALQKAEADAAQRAQVLISAWLPPNQAEGPQTLPQRLQERLPGWQAGLQQVEEQVSEADVTLRASEEELRRWLASAEAVRRSLADWASPEV